MSLAGLIVFLSPAFAADPTIELRWSAFVARLVITESAGEHVNEGAPASWSNGADEVRGTGALAWARLPFVAGSTFTASIPVCTDDGRACRVVTVSGRSTSGVASGKMRLSTTEARTTTPRPAGSATRVYDFGAVWCPPCNQLRAEVIDDPANAAALADVELQVLDVDKPESWPLKTRYAVGGYPTLVAVDAAGNEVDRMVGYESEAAALAWFAGLGTVTPLATLLAGPPEGADGAQAGATALRLAKAGHAAEAKRWLAVATPSNEAHVASLVLDPKPADVDWLLVNAPDGPWIPLALAAFPDRWPQLAARVPTLAASDVIAALDAYADAAPPDAALVARVAVTASLFGRLGPDVETNRGYVVDVADGLAAVGNLARALALLDEYARLYPVEFTFDFTACRLLLDAKRFPEAEARARTALSKAWGDQRLRAVQRLARALDAQGHRPEAIRVLEAELEAAVRPGPGVEVRTTRYLGEVEALLAELRR